MPTYQYACTTCGHHFEAVQSFTDEPLTECPACQGRLRKVFSSVGVVFKGSGFYRTDSRDSSRDSSRDNSRAKTSDPDTNESGRSVKSGKNGSAPESAPKKDSGGTSAGSPASSRTTSSSPSKVGSAAS